MNTLFCLNGKKKKKFSEKPENDEFKENLEFESCCSQI